MLHLALIVWAVVEVVRATHLHTWVRVALIVLSVLVAVVGPVLAIIAVRASKDTSPVPTTP